MKSTRKLLVILFLLIFVFPITAFAYSGKVILGGQNVGISVNTKEILVVGFYKVNNEYIAQNSGFMLGDKITKVNEKEVSSIDELIKEINNSKSDKVMVTVNRNGVIKNIELKLVYDGVNYKTGLYIKDKITGVGTITYIDPESKVYGSLGHEISDNKTGKLIDIKSGYIFSSLVTGTIMSTPTKTGEKRASFNQNEVYGTIEKNTNKGIYGKYTDDIDSSNLIEVGDDTEVYRGPAKVYTVLNGNEVKSYNINIIDIKENSETKNILFEITDKELMDKTNGVIKGMSGSPIVQNNKIVGAVTHAIVNDSTKGYGIFITSMLEEGDKQS